MANTATIDLISYKTTTVDSASSAKSSANNTQGFANILDNVNKTYTPRDNSSSNVSKSNHNNEKSQDSNNTITKTTDNTNTDKSSETNTVKEKVSEDNSDSKAQVSTQENSQQDSQETSSNDSQNADSNTKNETITDNTTIETTAKDNSETEAKTAVTQINDAETAIENLKEIADSAEELKLNTANAEQIVAKADKTTDTVKKEDSVPAENTKSKTDAVDSTNINLPVATQNIVEILALNPQVTDVTNNSNTKATDTNSVTSVQTEQNQAIQADFQVDLATLTKTLNNINTNQSTNSKAQQQIQQAQTLQVSPEIKTEAQNVVPQASNDTTQIDANIMQKADVQTPIIEVSTETLLSDVNLNKAPADTSKQTNAKDILDKTSLTQETLSKVNAKIMNVETSTSNPNLNSNSNPHSNPNSNNLKNNQNTQDQVVKLALDSNSSSSTINASNTVMSGITSDTTNQTNFSKTLDIAQAQTQPQSQAPKELSNTEILSQINNKLNSLKDENANKVTIVLKPENLGKINLELVTSKDGLTAQMTTNNPQVKEVLDKSLNSLKDSLSSQGVNVSSVTVKVDETQKPSSHDTFSFNQGQQNMGNQESSNNSQGQNQGKFSFGEEVDNVMTTITNEAETNTENENLVSVGSIGSHAGKVDYKV